jgi:FkbM family methyltransferase
MPLRDLMLAGPRWLKYEVLNGHARRSFSQEGEDLILARMLEYESGVPNVYVDVGANHPKRFSNTYVFYRRGWQGIAIEPDPDLARRFAARRPRDRVVEAGIAEKSGALTYFRFSDPAMNTFDPVLASAREADARWQLVERRTIPVRTLASVLGEHASLAREIGFMSVDVEGFDLCVLRSNDWERFRPRFVMAESLEAHLSNIERCPIHALMTSLEYEIVAKGHFTCFYRDTRCSR